MKMKLFVPLITVALIILFGCTSSSDIGPKTEPLVQTPITESNKPTEVTTPAETVEEIESKIDKAPINGNDLRPTFTLRDPDISGKVYVDATYTNTTEYSIWFYWAILEIKDTKLKTYALAYLSCTDTVMPGETSTNMWWSTSPNEPYQNKFWSAPQSGKIEDIEPIGLSIRGDKGTKSIYIGYDYELDVASWSEFED